MGAKPMFWVGVYGLDVRDVRLIEIVFKHSQYNKYEFKRSESTDASQADLLVLNTADPVGLAALNAASSNGKNVPVIAVVSRGSQTSARHAISIDRLTLQLLPILNRVVELELDTNGPETLPMGEQFTTPQQLDARREEITNFAAKLEQTSEQVATAEPSLNAQTTQAAATFVDLRILNEALKAAEPVPNVSAPSQFPELDPTTRQMPNLSGPVDNMQGRLASPASASVYRGAPLDFSAAKQAQQNIQTAQTTLPPTVPPKVSVASDSLGSTSTTAPKPVASSVDKKLVKFPSAELPSSHQRLRAMVVDDSPTVRTQLAAALTKMGMHAEAFGGAREALDRLETQHFDIVLVDVVMPEMDGYKLTKEIKRNKSLRGMPVVILTSKSSPFDLARGALAGCDTYLTKPVPLKQLEAALVKLLRKSLAIDDLSGLLRIGGSSSKEPREAKSAQHVEARTA